MNKLGHARLKEKAKRWQSTPDLIGFMTGMTAMGVGGHALFWRRHSALLHQRYKVTLDESRFFSLSISCGRSLEDSILNIALPQSSQGVVLQFELTSPFTL